MSELSFPWSQIEFSEMSREVFKRVVQWLDRGIRDSGNSKSSFTVSVGVGVRCISKIQFVERRTERGLEVWVEGHSRHHMDQFFLPQAETRLKEQ